jgi:signal peptidase II
MYPYFVLSHLRAALRQRLFVTVVVSTLLFDQITKWLAVRYLVYRVPVPIIPNYLSLTFVKNEGAAFGLFQGKLFIFLAAAIIAVFTILRILRKVPKSELWLRIGLALLLSGALGNFIDRIYHGFVVDFIDLHWYQYHWPVFNVADLIIDVGVVIILWKVFRPTVYSEDIQQEEPGDAPGHL